MSRMQCDEARSMISPFVDGELSDGQRQIVAEHVSGCMHCGAMAADFRALRPALAEVAYQRAAPDLEARIRARLSEEASSAPRRTDRPTRWQGVARQAAAIVLASGLSALAAWYVTRAQIDHSSIEHDVLSAHVRSLLMERPTQIASSDRHAVKPWFAGRLDFSPNVKDLTGEGFPLIGGRLDVVGERRIASLVYQRRLHVINVFVWPASEPDTVTPRRLSRNGYNGIAWTANGMTHWAVSDLNPTELEQFQALL
jgi:anti-sigma factor RsiW